MQKPDLSDLGTIQELAWRFRVHPDKKHSQNFLLDRSVVHFMAEESGIGKGDLVLEVGAGFGVLTEELLATGADVLAFEIDENLAAFLVQRFRGEQRFQLIVGDFFRWYRDHIRERSAKPFSIVANLPYHASSFFFEIVLASSAKPQQIIVLLQKEVAERIAAESGSMSLLSISVQLYGVPSVLLQVPKRSFWPQPDVDSAVLAVTDIHAGPENANHIFQLARMAFAGKRKQLHNTLAAGFHYSAAEIIPLLREAKIAETARPQELSIVDWKRLAETFKPLLENRAV